VVAVADVFDALASKRAYKDRWSLDDVFRHMEAWSGKHFDPAIIYTLLRNKDAITQLYEGTDQP
jgi:response regulator RpfG family c-di-GMP phosphodiesterase